MPRLKAAIQARKETALEALRDGLWAVGTNIRPMRGRPGYGAVRLAMAHWRPDFDDVPEKERKELLRAATKWDNHRRYTTTTRNKGMGYTHAWTTETLPNQ